MNYIYTVWSWMTTHTDIVAIFISVSSLIISLTQAVSLFLSNRINLKVDIKNIFLLTENTMFVEIAFTNLSAQQAVIQHIDIQFSGEQKGTLYDKHQIMASKKINGEVKKTAYITFLPRTIPPLDADRSWYRFDFSDNPLNQNEGNIIQMNLVANGKRISFKLKLPDPLTKENFFENI